MKNKEVESALRQHLKSLELPATARARWKLRELVSRYVDALKTEGFPPERVIVEVKRIASEVGVGKPTSYSHQAVFFNVADLLVVDMIGWCIERYYLASLPRGRSALMTT